MLIWRTALPPRSAPRRIRSALIPLEHGDRHAPTRAPSARATPSCPPPAPRSRSARPPPSFAADSRSSPSPPLRFSPTDPSRSRPPSRARARALLVLVRTLVLVRALVLVPPSPPHIRTSYTSPVTSTSSQPHLRPPRNLRPPSRLTPAPRATASPPSPLRTPSTSPPPATLTISSSAPSEPRPRRAQLEAEPHRTPARPPASSPISSVTRTTRAPASAPPRAATTLSISASSCMPRFAPSPAVRLDAVLPRSTAARTCAQAPTLIRSSPPASAPERGHGLDRRAVGPSARPANLRRRSRALGMRVRGTVQGVGFRPACTASRAPLGLAGFVRNDAEGVWIEIEGGARSRRRASPTRSSRTAPPLARIDAVESSAARCRAASAASASREQRPTASASRAPRSRPTPRRATPACASCSIPATAATAIPFINCTDCGPRYTIVRDVPYDRAAHDDGAVHACARAAAREYEDPADRRFHAEPNACPACGPRVALVGRRRRIARRGRRRAARRGRALIADGGDRRGEGRSAASSSPSTPPTTDAVARLRDAQASPAQAVRA